MKKNNIILESTLQKLVILIAVFTFLILPCFATNEYNINGKNIHWNDFSSSPSECWTYANNVYFRIWGQYFSNSFDDSNNSLRNLSDSDLTLTLDHLKAYVSNAALGSCLRICNSDYLHGSDGWGHSQIIVQKDDNGFTVFEGGLSQSPYCREKYYTWSEYINTNWLGGTYSYIKYIKWPGAPAYNNSSNPPSVTLSDFNISNTLVTGELPTLSGKIHANCTITWVWVGVSEGGTWNHLLQAQCNPMTNEFDISSLLSQLDFSSLNPGNYTMRIECTGGGEYWSLCAKDFQLVNSSVTLSDFNISDTLVTGESPTLSGKIHANCTITWVWVGVSEGGTWNHLLQAQCNPMTKKYDISSLLSQLDFSSLNPGNYTMRIECTGGGEYWSLCAKDFSVTSDISTSPFADIQNTEDYFYTPVLWAVKNGVTNGVDKTHFAPNQSCTRAQIVTFLWRAAGSPESFSNKNPFTDVKDGPYYKAILWAVENGITKGTTATTFAPNAACTRAQIVTFIYRAAGEPQIQNSINPFTDVKDGPYYKAILWAVENGITNGITATTFEPNATCTRGHGVTFLYRGRDLLQ